MLETFSVLIVINQNGTNSVGCEGIVLLEIIDNITVVKSPISA